MFNAVSDTVAVSCCNFMRKSVTTGGCHDVVIMPRNAAYDTSR